MFFFKCSLLLSLPSAALTLFSKDPWTDELSVGTRAVFCCLLGKVALHCSRTADAAHKAAWEGGDWWGFLEGCTCWDQSHGLPRTCLSLCCCILYLQTICKQLKKGNLGIRDMRTLPENRFTCPSEMLNKVLGSKDQD